MGSSTAVVCALAALAPAVAWAWGPEGHELVAARAEQALSEPARAELSALLGDDSLASVANLLDDRRREPGWAWSRPLHFANVPLDAPSFDAERDCAGGLCVVTAVEHYAWVAGDTGLGVVQRREAVEMLAHLVADLHQPLHVAHAHDRGGNDHVVLFQGARTDLHTIWDDVLPPRVVLDAPAAARLEGTPASWAAESLQLSRTSVYGAPVGAPVPSWYLRGAEGTAAQRLTLASDRLAGLLEAVLTGAPLPFERPTVHYDRSPVYWGPAAIAPLGTALVVLLLSVFAIRRLDDRRLLALVRVMGGRPGLLALAALAILATIAADLGLPLVYRHAIDVVIPSRDVWGVAQLAGLSGAALAIAVLGHLVSAAALARLAADRMNALRNQMTERLAGAPMDWLGDRPSSDLIARFVGDVPLVDAAVVSVIPRVMRGLLVGGGSLVMMLWLDWRLTVLALLLMPLGVAGPRVLTPRTVAASAARQEREGAAATVLLDLIDGMSTLRAFGITPVWLQRYRERADALARSTFKLTWLQVMTQGTSAIGMMAVSVSILTSGALLAVYAGVTVGVITAFFVLLANLASSVARISSGLPALAKGVGAMERIQELLELPAVDPPPQQADRDPRPLVQALTFRGVGFSYDESRRSLDRVDLQLGAGRRIAIVGPSGSGKSTLLWLLLRHGQAQEGDVLWDGDPLGGIPRAQTDAATALVPQRPIAFATTLRENIRLGNLAADDAAVEQAATRAALDGVVSSLAEGLSTPIGQGGKSLSGGEMQRVAIARALLREPSLLLLDEATSALDPRTADTILQVVLGLPRTTTVVAVTHDLAAVHRFDEVVMLEQGCVVGHGPHAELLASCAPYARLRARQSGLELGRDGRTGSVQPERLREIPLLAELPAEALEALATQIVVEAWNDGEVLFGVGDLGDRLLIVGRGQLEVFDADGVALGVVSAGDFIGEVALLRQGRRMAEVRARGFCTLFALYAPTLQEVLTRFPSVERSLEERAAQYVPTSS